MKMVFEANLILFVEKFLINMPESTISFNELLKEVKVIDKEILKEVLIYLDKINKILITKDGIIWVENNNKCLSNCINEGMEL